MLIDTTRFGKLDVDESQLLSFPKGLLGFPRSRRFVLIDAGESGAFWWLQSVDTPDLAFVVADPQPFVPTFRVPLKAEQLDDLGLGGDEEPRVLVIVNKRNTQLTGNLQGPLVVNARTRSGEQMVLSDRRFTTRQPLIEVSHPSLLAASA